MAVLRSISFHHTTSCLKLHEQRSDVHQQKKRASSGLMDLFPLRKKLLDQSLFDGTSRETTNVDDIMFAALVNATIAEAPLNGTLGVSEVIHGLWSVCDLTPLPSQKKCQSEPPPPLPQMSMTLDLPQCQEQLRGGGGPKNVSLREAVVDLPECSEGRRGKHKSTLRGVGVDLPECQERRRQAQKHRKVSVFFFW